MKKPGLLCAACFYVFVTVNAQQDSIKVDTTTVVREMTPVIQPMPETDQKPVPVYQLKPAIDIPITAAGTAWSLYAFTKIYSKDPSSAEQISSLKKTDVNGFDRWGIRPYNKKADDLSYIPFNGSMPMPLFFLLDNKMRKDFFKLSFLYLEAMSITGLLYTGSTYFTNRYRPYAYHEDTEFNYRTRGGAKNSFYGGHVALVATSTFFFARVYADYHPDSKIKWLFYSIAGAATASTAYMRYYGGLHFPSDLLLGIAQGTLTGILVPKLHKSKLLKDQNLSLVPQIGRTKGVALIYTFK